MSASEAQLEREDAEVLAAFWEAEQAQALKDHAWLCRACAGIRWRFSLRGWLLRRRRDRAFARAELCHAEAAACWVRANAATGTFPSE